MVKKRLFFNGCLHRANKEIFWVNLSGMFHPEILYQIATADVDAVD